MADIIEEFPTQEHPAGERIGRRSTSRSERDRKWQFSDKPELALPVTRRKLQTESLGPGTAWFGGGHAWSTRVRRCRSAIRGTAATLLLMQGVPARVAMQILGHSQISLTLGTYSHVVPELARDAADRIGSVLWLDDDQTEVSPEAERRIGCQFGCQGDNHDHHKSVISPLMRLSHEYGAPPRARAAHP